MGMSSYPAAIIITDTNAHTGRFGKITCLTDSTVTLVSPNVTKNGSSTVSGIDLKASTEIEGVFTSTFLGTSNERAARVWR